MIDPTLFKLRPVIDRRGAAWREPLALRLYRLVRRLSVGAEQAELESAVVMDFLIAHEAPVRIGAFEAWGSYLRNRRALG